LKGSNLINDLTPEIAITQPYRK